MVYMEVIIWFLVCFHCSSLRKTPGQEQIYQLFGGSLVSVKSIEKVISTKEQVQDFVTGGKRRYFASKKVRMNYSCHGRYKGIDIVFSLLSLLSS